MALTPEELTKAKDLKTQGFNTRQISGFIAGERMGKTSTIKSIQEQEEVDLRQASKTRFGSKKDFADIGGDIAQTAKGVVSQFKQGGEDIVDIAQDQDLSFGEKVRGGVSRAFTTGVRGLIDEPVKGAIKLALTPEQEEATKTKVGEIAENVADTDFVKDMVSFYEGLDTDTQREVDNALGFAEGLSEIGTAGLLSRFTKPLLNSIGKTVKETAKVGVDATKTVIKQADNVVDAAAEGTLNTLNLAENAGDNAITRAGQRFKTNVASNQATNEAIEALPSKVIQNSVRQGVELPDAQFLTKIPKAQRGSLGKLYDTTRKFVAGTSEVSPYEAVGKPIITRLKKLQGQTTALGTKLDKIATSLKGKALNASDDVGNFINDSLDNLGVTLKTSGKGKKSKSELNFVGSNLEGLGANESIIQNVYKRFAQAKDASDFHRLKKFIDNNVNFGKTAGGFTGEAERLLKGWRKQIDDALDNQFSNYNKVNTDLAQRIQPINALKDLLKADGLDTDLLNMKSGILARRITSNALSNPTIRQTLRDLDKATKVKGKVSLDIENLVEFLSVLEKYYPEIVGKNTFKGQMTGAVENVQGIQEMLVGSVKKLSGKTESVQREAINKLLDDLFKK